MPIREAQKQVDRWNGLYPVGSAVYWRHEGAGQVWHQFAGFTRTEARVLAGKAVIWVKDRRKAYEIAYLRVQK